MLEQKTTPTGADGAATVKSAQRILDIFELYASTQSPATLSAIASRLHMPKSSCLALLTTLASNGYIYEVRPQLGYYPTRRWLDKAQAISASDPVVREVRSYLEDLREKTGETLILGRLADRHILYIDVIESKQTLRYTAVAGQFKPLHGTASGKAALSALPPEQRRTLLESIELVSLTPRTIVKREALEREIEAGVARGWHVSLGENVADATAVAVPLLLMDEIFVLVVAGPTQRLEPNIAAVGQELCAARRAIEKI
jgi:IclR family transcriptional regulator, acetate operon repressor